MENIRIYWEYNQYRPVVRGEQSVITKELTNCIIETGERVVTGTAKQYHKDVPNRKVARKESFMKAVKCLEREERKIVWSIFNERFPKCVNCK